MMSGFRSPCRRPCCRSAIQTSFSIVERVVAGMATEPTVSALRKPGAVKVLVDMRSLEGTNALWNGNYPLPSLWFSWRRSKDRGKR